MRIVDEIYLYKYKTIMQCMHDVTLNMLDGPAGVVNLIFDTTPTLHCTRVHTYFANHEKLSLVTSILNYLYN